jgi:hypothetical protein
VALDYAAWKPERLLSLVVAASTGAVSEKEILDFSRRIEIPGVTWPSLHLEVGPSFIGSDIEGTARWEAIAEHARQPGAAQQPLRSPVVSQFEFLSTFDALPGAAVVPGRHRPWRWDYR